MTVIKTSVVTVSTAVLLVIADNVAVMFVVPWPAEVASPSEEMVATDGEVDAHVAVLVMFRSR